MKVAVSPFVRRQTADSSFSHYEGSWESLLALTEQNLDKAKQGYRLGVLLVPVPANDFYCGFITLKNGDVLVGNYTPRIEGEDPRKHLYAFGKKTPAKSVMIVLYAHDVLSENNEQSCEAEYEIISINASSTDKEVPMPVGTLIANHFNFSGGTSTKMTNDEFVASLKESAIFWKDKALVVASLGYKELP
jgi:hypothetical protein